MATDVAFTLPSVSFTAGTVFLTVERLRDFVTTDLDDASLQILINAAWESIDDAVGPPVAKRELLESSGDLLLLSRRAETIVSVAENARWTPLTLSADDYELVSYGEIVRRLHTGTNARRRWHGRVDVTYWPFDDMANRIRVAIELVKLDLAASTGSGGVLASQEIGTWRETYVTSAGRTYYQERDAILASLRPGMWKA